MTDVNRQAPMAKMAATKRAAFSGWYLIQAAAVSSTGLGGLIAAVEGQQDGEAGDLPNPLPAGL